jgi:hypothetical protein
MPLQTSGAISINDIRNELGTSDGSLRNLSATAGKGTPDSMSEFYGYSHAPGYVQMNMPYGGQTYDGCYMSMDSYGFFEGTGRYGDYVGPWGNYREYNTEGHGGTFLTFGGETAAYMRAGTTVCIYSITHGYGTCPCQPMYAIINVNGTRVATVQSTCDYQQAAYCFTVSPGASYYIQIGAWFG